MPELTLWIALPPQADKDRPGITAHSFNHVVVALVEFFYSLLISRSNPPPFIAATLEKRIYLPPAGIRAFKDLLIRFVRIQGAAAEHEKRKD